MKNLDLFSRRLLIVATSISMVLISSAIFLFSLNYMGGAQAKVTTVNNGNTKPINYYLSQADTIDNISELTDGEIFAVHTFGIGIRDGNLYFGILYNNNTIGLHVVQEESEDIIPW